METFDVGEAPSLLHLPQNACGRMAPVSCRCCPQKNTPLMQLTFYCYTCAGPQLPLQPPSGASNQLNASGTNGVVAPQSGCPLIGCLKAPEIVSVSPRYLPDWAGSATAPPAAGAASGCQDAAAGALLHVTPGDGPVMNGSHGPPHQEATSAVGNDADVGFNSSRALSVVSGQEQHRQQQHHQQLHQQQLQQAAVEGAGRLPNLHLYGKQPLHKPHKPVQRIVLHSSSRGVASPGPTPAPAHGPAAHTPGSPPQPGDPPRLVFPRGPRISLQAASTGSAAPVMQGPLPVWLLPPQQECSPCVCPLPRSSPPPGVTDPSGLLPGLLPGSPRPGSGPPLTLSLAPLLLPPARRRASVAKSKDRRPSGRGSSDRDDDWQPLATTPASTAATAAEPAEAEEAAQQSPASTAVVPFLQPAAAVAGPGGGGCSGGASEASGADADALEAPRDAPGVTMAEASARPRRTTRPPAWKRARLSSERPEAATPSTPSNANPLAAAADAAPTAAPSRNLPAAQRAPVEVEQPDRLTAAPTGSSADVAARLMAALQPPPAPASAATGSGGAHHGADPAAADPRRLYCPRRR